jgi:uncharacterized repeat protein (TIGR01451 family)
MNTVRRTITRLAVEVLEDRTLPSTFTPTVVTDTTAAGVVTLRDAIIQANADTGTADDTIVLAAGTYRLTLANKAGQENAAATGDLDIISTAHRLIIQGQGTTGARRTIIDAGQLHDRIFQIVGPGTVVELNDLILQGGLAQEGGSAGAAPGSTMALGGAILNNGGQLTLVDVVVQNNQARGGIGQSARGGGIYSSSGVLVIGSDTHGSSAFLNNKAVAGNGAPGPRGNLIDGPTGGPGGAGGTAQGGGVYLGGGALTLTGGTLSGNAAQGGNGGNGGNGIVAASGTMAMPGVGGDGGAAGPAQGGALAVDGAAISLSACSIVKNTATGGKGGNAGRGINGATPDGAPGLPGDADGGVLFLASPDGVATLTTCTVMNNTAQAGSGGSGVGPTGANGGSSAGGALYMDDGTLTVLASTIALNRALATAGTNGGPLITAGGTGGDGGNAQGGGVFAGGGQATIADSTIAGNAASGASGGNGGRGLATPSDPMTPPMPGDGGQGGAGGVGEGGGLDEGAAVAVELSNDTFAYNTVVAGRGGAAGAPSAGGNDGTPGQDGAAQGAGVAAIGGGTASLHNTLIALNLAAPRPNAPKIALFRSDFFGEAAVSSHNLIGDVGLGTGFSGAQGDQVGTDANPIDPHVTPLQNNGGPTLTVALLGGSPAIDHAGAVTTVAQDAAPTDQTIIVANVGALTGGATPIAIVIDGEPMLLTAIEVATDSLTVMRGANPVALKLGDAIAFALDQRGLARNVNGTGDIGAVEYQADLAVTMSAAAAVRAGGTIAYTITVTNRGPDSTAATLSDALPANTTFLALSAPAPWVRTVPAVGTAGTVTATAAVLAPGVKARFTLVVKLAAGATGTISNTASVGPLTWDSAIANNSVTAITALSK